MYRKDDKYNIVVVPEEADIQLRYILVFNTNSGYNNNGGHTLDVDLQGHYNKFLQN